MDDLPGQRQRRRRAVPDDGRGARPPRPRRRTATSSRSRTRVHGPVRTIGPIAELTATPAVDRPPGAAPPARTPPRCSPSGGATPDRGRGGRRRRRHPGRPLDGHHRRRVRHDHRRAAGDVDARRPRRPGHQGRADRRRSVPPPRRRRHAGRQDDGRQVVDLHRPQARTRAGASPSELAPHGRRRRAQRPARRARAARARRGAAARRQPRARLGVADRIRPPQPGADRRPSTHPCAGAATGGAGYQAGPALDGAVRDARRRPRDRPAS